MKLLHIDSSILGAGSVSRQLTAEIVARQKQLHPGLEVVRHDLAAEAGRHLSPAHLAAFQGASADAALGADLAAGESYLAEVLDADIIVIGAPMYNFSIPSQLKAWIDRVVVAGRTFRYGASGPEGLVPKGKTVFIASSRGGKYEPGSPAAALEHHESYLKGVLAFIGLTEVTVVRAEGIAMGDEARAAAIRAAQAQIAAIAA